MKKVKIGVMGVGHGVSDFYMMYNCVQKILGNQNIDVIYIYEALDM